MPHEKRFQIDQVYKVGDQIRWMERKGRMSEAIAPLLTGKDCDGQSYKGRCSYGLAIREQKTSRMDEEMRK